MSYETGDLEPSEDLFCRLDCAASEAMGVAEYFLEAADLDEKAWRFDWSDDQLWFVKRMANSHDLFHIVAGYDRDVAGEVGVIAYTAGQIPLLPLRMLLPYLSVLKPSRPIAWTRFVRASYRHGRHAPWLACVDYEALLPKPLAEARCEIGGRRRTRAIPTASPRSGGCSSVLRRMSRSYECRSVPKHSLQYAAEAAAAGFERRTCSARHEAWRVCARALPCRHSLDGARDDTLSA